MLCDFFEIVSVVAFWGLILSMTDDEDDDDDTHNIDASENDLRDVNHATSFITMQKLATFFSSRDTFYETRKKRLPAIRREIKRVGFHEKLR